MHVCKRLLPSECFHMCPESEVYSVIYWHTCRHLLFVDSLWMLKNSLGVLRVEMTERILLERAVDLL